MPAPLALSLDNRAAYLEDVAMLCEMLDRKAERNGLYVRWLKDALAAEGCRVLRDAANAARVFQDDAGLQDIMAETPFEVPAATAELAGAVSTFFSAKEVAPPDAVLELIATGCLLPALHLRSRARQAMEAFALECLQMNLIISVHTLLNFHHAVRAHAALPEINDALAEHLRALVDALLDVLNDAHEPLCHPAIMLIVLLDALAPSLDVYAVVREHADANKFGVELVSVINRGMFQRFAPADNGLVDVGFVRAALRVEAAADQPSSVFFPADLGVFAEVLEREVRDADEDVDDRIRSYMRLIKAIGAHPLRPDATSADLDRYNDDDLDEQ